MNIHIETLVHPHGPKKQIPISQGLEHKPPEQKEEKEKTKNQRVSVIGGGVGVNDKLTPNMRPQFLQ